MLAVVGVKQAFAERVQVDPGSGGSPSGSGLLIRESRLVAALEHPAIVTIHDVGEDDGQFYLVTELIEGETLRERLRRGPLPTREALGHELTIASALAAAHARGVVHRDLKPENVMIEQR